METRQSICQIIFGCSRDLLFFGTLGKWRRVIRKSLYIKHCSMCKKLKKRTQRPKAILLFQITLYYYNNTCRQKKLNIFLYNSSTVLEYSRTSGHCSYRQSEIISDHSLCFSSFELTQYMYPFSQLYDLLWRTQIIQYQRHILLRHTTQEASDLVTRRTIDPLIFHDCCNHIK